MDITRELAITILKYLDQHKDFHFPFLVMNREYSPEDEDFVEIEPNEWKIIKEDENYQTFQLWENLQDLRTDTLKLMTKGFIERIRDESLEKYIIEKLRQYRSEYKSGLWESVDSEIFGFNEYVNGKAEAYEDCLDSIRRFK